MAIYINATGGGFPVGGVLIGALRVPDPGQEPEFVCEEVPVAFFQGAAFAEKRHAPAIAKVAARLLDQLHAPVDEPVTVSVDYLFSVARRELRQVFSDVREGADGPHGELLLGKLAEAHHALLRGSYGVEIDLEVLSQKPGLAFFQALVWLKGGNPYKVAGSVPEREAVCKTGWASWPCWATMLYPEAKEAAKKIKEARQMDRDFGPRQAGAGGSAAGREKPGTGPGEQNLPF